MAELLRRAPDTTGLERARSPTSFREPNAIYKVLMTVLGTVCWLGTVEFPTSCDEMNDLDRKPFGRMAEKRRGFVVTALVLAGLFLFVLIVRPSHSLTPVLRAQ